MYAHAPLAKGLTSVDVILYSVKAGRAHGLTEYSVVLPNANGNRFPATGSDPLD